MGAGYVHKDSGARDYWVQEFAKKSLTISSISLGTILHKNASTINGKLIILKVLYTDKTYSFVPVIKEMCSVIGSNVIRVTFKGKTMRINLGESTPVYKRIGKPKAAAGSTTKSSAKIVWKKVTGATSYVVYRATSKDGTYKKVGTTTALSYTNKSLKAAKTYYYKVTAKGKVRELNSTSAYSNIVSVKTKK
jgi:cytochrome c oxidase assembly protein Cox11